MAVEDLGQKNHEIGSDPYLDYSAPTRARDRVESRDSGRERNAGFDRPGPATARMDFFNGLSGPVLSMVDPQLFAAVGKDA